MPREIKKDVLAFLHNSLLGVVATISAEGLPSAATVHMLVDDSLNVYFVTQRSSRKFQNIMRQPKVAMVIGTELDPRTVQIEGVAELLGIDLDGLSQQIGRPGIADIYKGALPEGPFPYFKVKKENTAIFKVAPTWMRYMELDHNIDKNIYYQIIP
jgi:uncharacterized pyridoxamine 5'-phosphate oxidase family protein